MLRFWLLEHTTATRSGEEGMAAQGRAQLPPRGSETLSAPAAARTKWRREPGGGRCRDVSPGPRRPAAANRGAGVRRRRPPPTIERERRGGGGGDSASPAIEPEGGRAGG